MIQKVTHGWVLLKLFDYRLILLMTVRVLETQTVAKANIIIEHSDLDLFTHGVII